MKMLLAAVLAIAALFSTPLAAQQVGAGCTPIGRGASNAYFSDCALATGTANAITLSPTFGGTPTSPQLVNFTQYRFRAVATNTDATTARIGSLTAYNVYVDTPTGPAALRGGEIITGNWYTLGFDPTLNSAVGGWHLLNATLRCIPNNHSAQPSGPFLDYNVGPGGMCMESNNAGTWDYLITVSNNPQVFGMAWAIGGSATTGQTTTIGFVASGGSLTGTFSFSYTAVMGDTLATVAEALKVAMLANTTLTNNATFAQHNVVGGTEYVNVEMNWGLLSVTTTCSGGGSITCIAIDPPKNAIALTNLTWSGGTVTATTLTPHQIKLGTTAVRTVSGATPSGYNGTYTVTFNGASTFTYATSNPGALAPLTISSGTYNTTTGVIVLTMSAPVTLSVNSLVSINSLTGTGNFATLTGAWPITSVVSSTVTLNGPIGSGASAITGGTLTGAVNGFGTRDSIPAALLKWEMAGRPPQASDLCGSAVIDDAAAFQCARNGADAFGDNFNAKLYAGGTGNANEIQLQGLGTASALLLDVATISARGDLIFEPTNTLTIGLGAPGKNPSNIYAAQNVYSSCATTCIPLIGAGTNNIPLTALAQSAANTILGNNTGSPANVTALTRAQIGAMSLAPVNISVEITGVNFNSANTDNAMAFTLPTGYTRIDFVSVQITNASASLTTATMGVFSTTGGGGTAILSGGTAITVNTASDATVNNMQNSAMTNPNTISFIAASLPTPNTVYFRVGTAEGSAATADVALVARAYPHHLDDADWSWLVGDNDNHHDFRQAM